MTTHDSTTTTEQEARERALASLPDYITPGVVNPVAPDTDTSAWRDGWDELLHRRHVHYLTTRGYYGIVARERGYATADTFADIEPLASPFEWGGSYETGEGKARHMRLGVADWMSKPVGKGSDAQPNRALVLPLYHPQHPEQPQAYQIRLDSPRPGYDEDGNIILGKKLKFEVPSKAKRGVLPGFIPPDVHPMVEDDGRAPLIKTEGVPKGDSILCGALREGLNVIPVSYTGVTMPYEGAQNPDNPTGKARLTPTVMESFDLSGRVVYLCWDADWRTNRMVRDALITTGELLEEQGAVVRIVDVPPVNEDEKSGVDDYLADAYARGLRHPLAELLANAVDLATAEAETRRYEHTDMGRATRLADEVLRTGTYRWSATRECWLGYTGTHWESADRGGAAYLAMRLTDRDPEDKGGRSGLGVSSAMKLARAVPGVTVIEEDMDQDKALLNTRTGTVDLRTGELMPHNPNDLITMCTPVGYDPSLGKCKIARCAGGKTCEHDRYQAPTLDRLLKLILPNRETRRWVQRAMGMAIMGILYEDLMLQVVGPGQNGKSTLFKAIFAAIGPYMEYGKAGMLTDRDGAKPWDLAKLAGVRLFLMPETDEGDTLNSGTMKVLAGRERISAAHKHGRPFSFDPSHTAILMTNHEPRVKGVDTGTWRRIALVPFLTHVTEENRISDPDTKLAMEAAGVLAWLVDGAVDYANAGYRLGTCPEVEAATQQYREEQDLVGRWIADAGLVFEPKAHVPQPQFNAAFRAWCEAQGQHSFSAQRLLKQLIASGRLSPDCKHKSNGPTHLVGVRFPTEAERIASSTLGRALRAV